MFAPALLLIAGAIAATGAEWLARADAAASPAKDSHTLLHVVATDDRGQQVERDLELWQKGTQQRLVRLTAPPRLAGVGLLVSADEVVHLYLPSYGRVRRVIGAQRGDAFLGTDISMEDLARTGFSGEYTAEVVAEGAEEVELKLTPTDPAAHRHAATRLWLRTSDALWTRLEHLDASGAVLDRVELSDFRLEGRYTVAHRWEAHDLARGRATVATIAQIAFDQGLSDDLFTVTNLSRP